MHPDNEYRSDFGQRLKSAREEAGYTQARACKAIGISQSTLSELEKIGLGSAKTVAFAKLYGVSPDWLASGEGTKKPILKVEEQGAPYLAHGLSHQPEQTPTLTREKLMSGVEVKGEFWVELWDDAIGQELPRGTLTLWDAGLQPEVGDFVLIRTADGRPHVRVYGESLAHGWQGKPLHSDYEAIPGTGAKVLAVFVSAKVRRSQLRR